ncbi:hypothetical protein [Nocardia abscessus]|uniref:hypothetical protein n=1 Tax=Nocardia abscessus TaxID=120957 RepID=UPI002454A6A8|nr:hypothetical protein [Nocardia abscessus]
MHSLAIHQLNVLSEQEAHQAPNVRAGKARLPEQSTDVHSPKTIRPHSAQSDLLGRGKDQVVC